jgi:hypothetical protein
MTSIRYLARGVMCTWLAAVACNGDGDGATGDGNGATGTDTEGQCQTPPEVPPGASDECTAQLLSCYSEDCDSFEYDPNDCWNTTLEFPVCESASGGSSTGTDSGTDTGTDTGTSTGTDTEGQCQTPPEVPPGASDDCAAQLLSCYSEDCDSFEYDPNDCWNTTLEFPVCEGASEGTSTG